MQAATVNNSCNRSSGTFHTALGTVGFKIEREALTRGFKLVTWPAASEW